MKAKCKNKSGGSLKCKEVNANLTWATLLGCDKIRSRVCGVPARFSWGVLSPQAASPVVPSKLNLIQGVFKLECPNEQSDPRSTGHLDLKQPFVSPLSQPTPSILVPIFALSSPSVFQMATVQRSPEDPFYSIAEKTREQHGATSDLGRGCFSKGCQLAPDTL
jgi:hypothetical protein